MELPKFSIKQTAPSHAEKKSSPKENEQKKVVKEEPKQKPQTQKQEALDTIVTKTLDEVQSKSSETEGEQAFDFVNVIRNTQVAVPLCRVFISSKLVYPNTALRNKIEGVVVVGFVVDKEGRLRNPE